MFPNNGYSTPGQYDRPSSAQQQQPQPTYGGMNQANMNYGYAQQQQGMSGTMDQSQQPFSAGAGYAAPGTFASSNGGSAYGMSPQGMNNMPSTSALLAQQIANQNNLNQGNNPAAAYAAQQQALYRQQQQQQQQQHQQQQQQHQQQGMQAGGINGGPTQQQQQYGSYANGGQVPTSSYPPMSQPPQQAPLQGMSAESQQNLLRGISLQGLTPERFAALQPAQQTALRQIIAQKQQQAHAQQIAMSYQSGHPNLASAATAQSPSTQQNQQQNEVSSPIGAANSPAAMQQRPTSFAGSQPGFRPGSQSQIPQTPQQQPNQSLQQHQAQSQQRQHEAQPQQASTPQQQQPQRSSQPPQVLASQLPPQTPQQVASSQAFIKNLTDFFAKRGQTFPGQPTIDGKVVDLALLYQLSLRAGGFQKIHQGGLWRPILQALGFPPDNSGQQPESRVQQIAQAYHSLLLPFETMWVAVRNAQMQHQQAQQQAQQQQQQQQGGTQASSSRPTTAGGAAPSPLNSTVIAQSPGSMSGLTPSTPSQQSYPMPTRTASISGSATVTAPSAASAAPTPSFSVQQTTTAAGQSQPASTSGSMRISVNPQPAGPAANAPLNDAKDKVKLDEIDLTGPTNGLQAPGKRRTEEGDATATPASIDFNTRPGSASRGTPIDTKPELLSALSSRRKRQKYTYLPLARPVESLAGYDVAMLEEVVHMTSKRRPQRQAGDLGLVDMHSLIMSLRSRLVSEVAFALNSLTLISLAMKAHDRDGTPNTFVFSLAQCGDLFEELVDLLEETAFGGSDDEDSSDGLSDGSDDNPKARRGAIPTTATVRSYRDLFRLVAQEESELLEPPRSSLRPFADLASRAVTPLGPVELCLAIVNLLRNLSISEDNAAFMSRSPRFVDILVKIANLPLKRDCKGQTDATWPLRVSAADSMTLRKDALELLTHAGFDVRLDNNLFETAERLFDLLVFFLVDADDSDQLYFDFTTAPTIASRIPQPAHRIGHYLELGLAAFARIPLLDANRRIFARLTPKVDLFAVFESLVRLLPVEEADFQFITSEAGLVTAENLLMSIYNLAFLAPVDLKQRLRVHPGFIRSLLRIVRRLAGPTAEHHDTNPFLILTERCIATLHVLSDLTGIAASDVEASEGLWWGLPMGGDENDKPSSCQPTEADRGTVKQRLPPSALDGQDLGPPVLAGEARNLFELLGGGSMLGVFGSLAPLMDATRSIASHQK